MAKQVKQYIKNPKYGQPGEPERILFPQTISENGAFLNRMAQIEKLEYNATQVTGNNYNGLAEALASVTNDKYKVKGIVLTWFDSTENQWKSMRYNGADSTGWGEVGNWVEAGVATGASEHTLDLSPLFDSEGSPVATVTDEFLAEVKKAYEGKFSNGYMLEGYVPMNLLKQTEKYIIQIVFPMPSSQLEWVIAAYTFTINETDKTVLFSPNSARFVQSGEGNKALTDNGQYAEFVPEAPADGKTYGRNNKKWVETSGGTQYLDLSMFSEESGTLSEEDYQKVVKAYEDKIDSCIINGYLCQLSINNQDGKYILYISIINIIGVMTISCLMYTLNNDKSYTMQSDNVQISSTGSGTKVLTDNGQYAEFASPIKTQDGGTGAVTKELQPNTFYKFGDCSSLTITLAAKKPNIFNEYIFEFKCGESPTTLSLPESIEWDRGDILSTKALNKYIISIIENIATYKEVVWYKKVESIQVNNTSDTYYVRINGVDINKVDSFLYRIGDKITLFAWNSRSVSIILRYKDGTTAIESTSNNVQNVITIEKEINQVIINY